MVTTSANHVKTNLCTVTLNSQSFNIDKHFAICPYFTLLRLILVLLDKVTARLEVPVHDEMMAYKKGLKFWFSVRSHQHYG